MTTLSVILQRAIYCLLLMVAVIILNFLLIQLAPGDIVEVLVGEWGGASAEVIAQVRAQYGLDKSIPEQLMTYVRQMIAGDLGTSFYYNKPVLGLILERIPATLLLAGMSLLLAIAVGTTLGIFSAQRPHGLFSHFVTVISMVGYSAPLFWSGIMLLILFGYFFPIFPVCGSRTLALVGSAWDHLVDVFMHMVLPTLTLASVFLAQYSRLARASMLDVLGSDYIRTARSKGLGEGTVIYKHALKNALLPVVTMAGLNCPYLIAGTVVVETVFSWPGMGQLAFESILRRDHPLLLGILFFSALIVIIANFLTDLSYRLLDPRIKGIQQ